MPAILLKQVPDELHRRLKEEAARHHRSMTGHALALIEQGLGSGEELALPPPEKPRRRYTHQVAVQAIRQGRV